MPCPSPGDLPDPGIELGSPALQVDSLPAELPGKPTLSYSAFQTPVAHKDHVVHQHILTLALGLARGEHSANIIE